MRSTACYARYSTDLQNERSIDDQIAVCRRLPQQFGLPEITRLYSDKAMSGASAARPDYQRLRADVRKGLIGAVIVEHCDRLSRDQAEMLAFYRELKLADCHLYTFADGQVNALQAGVHGIMSEHQREEIGRKTKRGLEGRAKAGRHLAQPAYGYRRVDNDAGARVIVEEEAEVVRRIFSMYAAGRSTVYICKTLNDEGVPGPRGGKWYPFTISGDRRSGDGVLNNELYVGTLVYNRHRWVRDPDTNKRAAVIRPEGDRIRKDAPHLRIVTDDLWNAARGVQSEKTLQPLAHRKRPKRLLSGLIFCGICGGHFTVENRDRLRCKSARDGRCRERGRLPISAVERRVVDGIKDHLLEPDVVADAMRAYVAHVRRRDADANRRRHGLVRDLEEARRRADRLGELLIAGEIPTLRDKLIEADTLITSLGASIEALGPAPAATLHPTAAEAYRRRVMSLEQSFSEGSPEPRRHELIDAVRPLIRKVVVRSNPTAPDGWDMVLHGQLATILYAAEMYADGYENGPAVSSGATSDLENRVSADRRSIPVGTASVGAGVGFEPTTFRL